MQQSGIVDAVWSDDGDTLMFGATCMIGWDPKIDQAKLRVLLRRQFNMWTKGYMKHVAPVFMIRQLARCQPRDEVLLENSKYGIQVKKTRKQEPSPGEDPVIALETKITFYPLPAVDIEIFEPEGEDWSVFEKDGSHYDPAGHVECNVLNCFLEHGLPQGFLVAPEPPKRQRKSNVATTASERVVTDVTPPVTQGLESDAAAPIESVPKKRGKPKKASTTASVDASTPDVVPKKRGRPPKDSSTASAKRPPKKPKGRQEVDEQVKPPLPVFRLPRAFSFTSSANSTQSPGDSTQPGQSSELLNQQVVSTRRATDSPSQSSRLRDTPQAHAMPKAGEAASPATLRALRAATWDLTGPKELTPTSSSGTPRVVPPSIPSGAVYIDLTD
jgi:hypothetical protein